MNTRSVEMGAPQGKIKIKIKSIKITERLNAVIQPKLTINKYYHIDNSKKENDNVSASYHL